MIKLNEYFSFFSLCLCFIWRASEVNATRDTLQHEIVHALQKWSGSGLYPMHSPELASCTPRWRDMNFGLFGLYDSPVYKN